MAGTNRKKHAPAAPKEKEQAPVQEQAETVEEPTPPAEPTPEPATAFPVTDLIAAAPAVFGVKPEIMAGALYGIKEATKEEAQRRLDEFMKGV